VAVLHRRLGSEATIDKMSKFFHPSLQLFPDAHKLKGKMHHHIYHIFESDGMII
jgi:hypothetical protein